MIVKNEVLELEGFNLAGISVRTINKDGHSQKDIGELWGRFLGGNLSQQLNDKVSDDLYCVYTDYESDHLGYYTCLLGCKVSSVDAVPDGFTTLTVAGGKYRRYTIKGMLPESVWRAWMQIWETKAERAFTIDFDVLGAKAQNPTNAEVETYVAIK